MTTTEFSRKTHAQTWSRDLEQSVTRFATNLFSELQNDEALSISFAGERSFFLRFAQAKVRQSGMVDDATVELRLMKQDKQRSLFLPYSGDPDSDVRRARHELAIARQGLNGQPRDPSLVLPLGKSQSTREAFGALLAPPAVPEALLGGAQDIDLCGLYAGGPVARGYFDSAQQSHWFVSETFFVDYSVWHPSGKAVKSMYSGSHWQDGDWARSLADARKQLAALDLPMRSLPPGSYRAFLEPAALSTLVEMFSWQGLSEMSMRQKAGALLRMREDKAQLSPLFTLRESFRSGMVPRFTTTGDLAPEEVVLIEKGQLKNTLVSSRTGKEYNIPHNGACLSEVSRSPVVDGGSLRWSDRLQALGTGLYLPNLHYLNWSDLQNARVTGMTRFAALWVEDGKYQGPIADLRFDDSLYQILGTSLEALTEECMVIPDTDTYSLRKLSALVLPGALVSALRFTL